MMKIEEIWEKMDSGKHKSNRFPYVPVVSAIVVVLVVLLTTKNTFVFAVIFSGILIMVNVLLIMRAKRKNRENIPESRAWLEKKMKRNK